MIIFLFMNCIVAFCSFLAAYRIMRLSSDVDAAIAFIICYFAQIVFSLLLLGAAGLLYIQNVILFNLVILGVLLFFSPKRDKVIPEKTLDIREILSSKTARIAFSVVLGFALVKIAINLVNPPFGWDSLNYHFTFPVEWLKHGNLNNPIVISDDPAPTYYPINGSLIYLWLMLPFKNCFISDLGQIPFFALMFLAVFSLSKKLGLSAHYAFLCACLFSLIPNYFKHMKLAYVDAMVASLFISALNFLFLLKKEFSGDKVFLFSLALGLLLGTKSLGLLYVLLLLLPLVYLYLKYSRKPGVLLIVFFTVLAFGGFSYIRNLIETGNPLFPLEIKLFGRLIFPGVIDNNTYRAHFELKDYSLSKMLFHEGLGPQSLLFILPAMFLALPVYLYKNKKKADFVTCYFLLLPFLIYLVYRYMIPLANTRYLYNLLALGMICAFLLMRMIKIPKAWLNSLAVIMVLSSISELAKKWELISASFLSVILFFCLLYFLKKRLFMKAILLGFVATVIFLQPDYKKNEYPRYIKMVKYSGFWPDATAAWNWLNDSTSGNNIAYVGRPVPFPLYGSDFKNNVFYVSLNQTDPAKLHYFSASRYSWGHDFLSLHKSLEAEDNYRGNADYEVWSANLRRRNADFLFVYSLHQTKGTIFPLEDRFARDNPAVFKPVFSNDSIRIYKIIR